MPLIDVTYIIMEPFEALYCRKSRTPLYWDKFGESVILWLEIIQQATEKIKMIQEKMRALQSHQKSYHDKWRKTI